ncbi:MAG TPA: hypothetical protein PLD43_03580 [Anaerolineae bacterium]|nr:hypothetical protein [Anaerolineae bacterium]
MNSGPATSTQQRASARLAPVRLGIPSPAKPVDRYSLYSPLTAHIFIIGGVPQEHASFAFRRELTPGRYNVIMVA